MPITHYEYALMSKLSYKPCNRESPKGWSVCNFFTRDHSTRFFGFSATAFQKEKEIVIAFRGTKVSFNLITDILLTKLIPENRLELACQFIEQTLKKVCFASNQNMKLPVISTSQQLVRLFRKNIPISTQSTILSDEYITKVLQKTKYSLSFTGHSLGAFFAELCACRYHLPAVTFESPGCLALIANDDRFNTLYSAEIKQAAAVLGDSFLVFPKTPTSSIAIKELESGKYHLVYEEDTHRWLLLHKQGIRIIEHDIFTMPGIRKLLPYKKFFSQSQINEEHQKKIQGMVKEYLLKSSKIIADSSMKEGRIITYLTAPNLVNTVHQHIGTIERLHVPHFVESVFPKLSTKDWKGHISHGIRCFLYSAFRFTLYRSTCHKFFPTFGRVLEKGVLSKLIHNKLSTTPKSIQLCASSFTLMLHNIANIKSVEVGIIIASYLILKQLMFECKWFSEQHCLDNIALQFSERTGMVKTGATRMASWPKGIVFRGQPNREWRYFKLPSFFDNANCFRYAGKVLARNLLPLHPESRGIHNFFREGEMLACRRKALEEVITQTSGYKVHSYQG